ncbi:MAG TPA: hypothetical protein VFQ53_43675 [Kofleriaceae bacterium]|nr:hypothetical protein [Kofleriaceae bacterium]
MKLVSSLVFTSFVAVASPALAQPAPPEMPLPNIMSTAPGLSLEARFDYTDFDFLADNVDVLGLNVQLQYVGPRNWGGYLNIPFGFVDGPTDNEGAIGNLELGGLYVIRSGPGTDFYIQPALALDTADRDGELFVPLAHVLARPADAFPTGLDTNWLRIHGGLQHTAGALRIGGRVGLDFTLDNDDDNALLVAAGSVGIQQRGWGISGGLTLLDVLDDNNNNDDDTIVALNIMADFNVGQTALLFVSLGTNFEDDYDGYSLGVGVRFGL